MALFSRSKKGVVGLDIGSSAVKLVELTERKAGEFHLQRLDVELLSPEAIVDGSIMDSSLVVDAIHKLKPTLCGGCSQKLVTPTSSLRASSRTVNTKSSMDTCARKSPPTRWCQ